MQHERSMEREKVREAKGPDQPVSCRGGWADWETRSDLAAVGLKFWALDWESLEHLPPKVGKRSRVER
jgi:hypothetical protein